MTLWWIGSIRLLLTFVFYTNELNGYKFRLITTCPAPIFDSLNQSRTQIRENVTSYADLTVSTNQPPIGKSLEVTPLLGGVGMRTIFKFSTGVALDDSDDYPLKYNFQIGFDGVKISIGEFYENMVTASQLPYSETNITTMYEVCDAREACSTVNGPPISTTMPLDKDIDLDDIISNVKASMSRMEYDQSFGFALIVGTTLKNHKLFTDFKESFTKIVRTEINKLLEGPTTDYYVSTSEIIKFVNYSKTSFQIINEDDGINRGLLELLETTENDNQVRSEPAKASLIRKRSVRDVDNKIAKINLELNYLEKLVGSKDEATSVEAMKRLVEKVKQIVTRLCNDSSFTYTNFNKSIINMEVRETNVNQIIRTNLTVPYDIEPNERRAYIQINENLKVNPRSKFCVGKIMFPSDYLSGQRNANEIYDLIIVEKSKLEINTVDISDGGGGSEGSISLSIPIKKESGNFECQIWENGEWSSNICTTSSIRNGYVYCRCKKISVFRATEKQNTEMATTTTTTITTASGAVTTAQILNTTLPLVPVNITDSNGTTMESLVTTANAVTTSIIQSMATEPATTTLSSFSYNDNLPTTASTNLSIGNGTVLNTTASDIIEVVTLAPTDTSTLITALTSTSTTLTPATITETTKLLQNTTMSSVATNNYTESVMSTIISSVDSNNSVLQKETLTLNGPTAYSSSTGYTLAVIFIIAGIFIVVGLFLYNRRKKPNSLAQQLEIISSEIRTSNNAVKYARFHDEDTMRGDNIETIFTAQ